MRAAGILLNSLDPARTPRRFKQAGEEFSRMKTNLADSERWLADHDKHCKTCGGSNA